MLDKKEELFREGNLKEYEIANEIMNKLDKNLLLKDKDYSFKYMCTKDNEAVANLKRIYAYYNSTFLSEFERIKLLNAKRHSNQFTMISEKHSNILTDVS